MDLEYIQQLEDVKVDTRTDDPYTRELPSAVAWAMKNNITNGTTPTTFSPTESVTRGHIVTFLFRFAATDDGKRVLK